MSFRHYSFIFKLNALFLRYNPLFKNEHNIILVSTPHNFLATSPGERDPPSARRRQWLVIKV